ncbi:hypothetical protein CN514_11115 [Bacillus sp. AFS001701]|nr:hypothetical protein CN514_11115 [Bacillus sp. AFS001701]
MAYFSFRQMEER